MSHKVTRRDAIVAASAIAPAALVGCKVEGGAAPAPLAKAPGLARSVERVVAASPTTDGAGVKLHRSIGSRELSMLDPFLMLDEFFTDNPDDYIAGFPDHPHRGFETVTYMIHGAMEHHDSIGNRGRLGPGAAQWMTAGSGIIHAEMPKQEKGLMWGFQLWVNLPAKLKMTTPRYQDIAPDRIPEVTIDDAHVRVVAGEANGVRGPVDGIVTAPTMIDVQVPANGHFAFHVPTEHSTFAYVFDGEVSIGTPGTSVSRGKLAVLTRGDVVAATSASGGRFLLLAAAPIREPVARYGPFVMNTEAEIRQAISDYRNGTLVRRS